MGNCCRSNSQRETRQLRSLEQSLPRLRSLSSPSSLYNLPSLSSLPSPTSETKYEVSPQKLGSGEPEYVSHVQIEPFRLWTSSPYGCASFDVTNKATTIEWKGYGLKIKILDDSIPHYLTTARLDTSVHYFNNRGDLPLLHGFRYPISALYSIKVGSGKLCKPVTIEIQHCHVTFASEVFIQRRMTLLRASNEGEYFRPVIDAVFDQRTNCGRVTVPKLDQEEYNDFSWFIIAIRWVFFPNTIHYKAQVYISKTTMMMHFIVTMAIDLCSTVVEAKYDDYYLHTSFPVQFNSGRILLNVPEEGKTLKSGWIITPLYYPSITKRLVDRFCIFHNDIPKCEFSLQCKRSPPARLRHKITLTEGRANGKKHFCIDFDPPRTSSIVPASDSAPNTSVSNSVSIPEQADCFDMTQGTSVMRGTVLSNDLSTESNAQHSGKNTTEYQTIKKYTPQLITAFKHNLTELSSHLLSKGLITADQSHELRNQMHSKSDRAAKLMDFVLSKVELAPVECYNAFVEALEQDKHTNELVLELLKPTCT